VNSYTVYSALIDKSSILDLTSRFQDNGYDVISCLDKCCHLVNAYTASAGHIYFTVLYICYFYATYCPFISFYVTLVQLTLDLTMKKEELYRLSVPKWLHQLWCTGFKQSTPTVYTATHR